MFLNTLMFPELHPCKILNFNDVPLFPINTKIFIIILYICTIQNTYIIIYYL